MRVVLVNSVCGIGSTGRICADLAKEFEVSGNEVKIAYGRDSFVPEEYQKYAVRIGSDLDVKYHAIYTRVTDKHGLASKAATRKFLKWLDEFKPDLLWLHNIHGYYINYEMLFAWIKKHPDLQVKWTLHDCWAFTGHCSHFIISNCSQWKTQCAHCTQLKDYPKSFGFGNVRENFERKKAAFTGVRHMTIITPSKWLANLVKQSFLKEYPVEVHYNTIDGSVFKPTDSDFRDRYNLEGKKIILGVSNVWNDKKGLNDFFELSDLLGADERIVLVGVDENQIKDLKPNMIGIPRTASPRELAEIYTAADVFFNPTYEDNYPTVNLEAKACGTWVIAYETGGVPETIGCEEGIIIKPKNYNVVLNQIRY